VCDEYERPTGSDLAHAKSPKKRGVHDNFRRMRTLRTITLGMLAVGLATVTSACGHTKGVVPVDSPLVQWQPADDVPKPTAPDATAPAAPETTPAAKPGK
jgi:hypothetical protein